MEADKLKLSGGSIKFYKLSGDLDPTLVSTLTADISGNIIIDPNSRIKNIANPISDTDVSNKIYVDTTLLTHTNRTDNPHQVNKDHIGLNYVNNIKCNLSATEPPSSINNLSQDYITGSRWLDVLNKMEYLCVSSDTDTAEWVNINIADFNYQDIYDKINNLDTHHIINDSLISVSNLWSADKINSELITRANSSHQHLSTDITDFSTAVCNNSWVSLNTSHRLNKANPHEVTKAQLQLGNVQNIKNNFLQATLSAPTAADDSFLGYQVGSKWINRYDLKEYVCIDDTINTAKWKLITNEPGEVNIGQNLGSGKSIYVGKLDAKLQFKSIKAGNLITCTSTGSEITVNTQNSHTFLMAHTPIDVSTTEYVSILYFPWVHNEFSSYKNGKVAFRVTVLDRNLDIQMYNSTEQSVVGSHITIANSGFYSFSTASPSSDASLELRIRKDASGGTDPRIYGIVLKFES